MWFVEIIDTGDNFVTRYIPVRANSMGEASKAARASGLESFERIRTIASRNFFEAKGVKNLPPDSAAITVDPAGPTTEKTREEILGEAEAAAEEARLAREAQEAKRLTGDPMIEEAVGGRYGGAGVGFDRALGEFGYGSGVLRSIMNAKRAPLEALASLGYAGRSGADLFQNLREGREYQDIFGKAFRGMAGDRDPGAVGGRVMAPFSLSGSARELFDVEPTGGELASMYNPVLGAAAGTSGMPAGVSGDAAARLVAELGLAGYGRGRFGAMSAFLPSADQLVADFASQPIGTGQSDIREYIRNRLTR